MELREIVERAAWRSGAGVDLTDRVVEALLLELRDVLVAGEVVRLGDLGTFVGPAFRPGPGIAEAPGGTPSGLEGYDEGVAPSDS